jgi:acetolactate synthase-1/2/3 large subunit
MGYSIPAAIGAAIGNPSSKVVALLGDGCFLMSGFEILTAVQESLDLLVVVFNNGCYGFIKKSQEAKFGATLGTSLVLPDFKKLADSLGIHYMTCRNDMEASLHGAMERKGVTLLEIEVCNQGEKWISKMMKRGKRSAKRLLRRL